MEYLRNFLATFGSIERSSAIEAASAEGHDEQAVLAAAHRLHLRKEREDDEIYWALSEGQTRDAAWFAAGEGRRLY